MDTKSTMIGAAMLAAASAATGAALTPAQVMRAEAQVVSVETDDSFGSLDVHRMANARGISMGTVTRIDCTDVQPGMRCVFHLVALVPVDAPQ